MFIAAESDRSSFVDLDVPMWGWFVALLVAAIVFSIQRAKQIGVSPVELAHDHDH